ncbi:MAG: EF-Tu/IF-2/RF-3 family GTPase [Acutalibacteraceae bacterium]|nr:EF-Tu/IF-2/RF-3 family GTPase [Acutalibacteraceae bacterium]
MGLFDFFKKKQEKSDVEAYYDQRSNVNNGTYNTMDNSQLQNNIAFNPNAPFCMEIEDVFTITRKGTVVTGNIQSGFVKVGDMLNLQHIGSIYQVQVRGIEQFRKQLEFAHEGDFVGVLLSGVTKSDISRGDLLIK